MSQIIIIQCEKCGDSWEIESIDLEEHEEFDLCTDCFMQEITDKLEKMDKSYGKGEFKSYE